jgi:hypothetical protein
MCRILIKEKNDAEIELNYFDLCVFFSYLRQINYEIFTSVYRLLRLPVVAILTIVREWRHLFHDVTIKGDHMT